MKYRGLDVHSNQPIEIDVEGKTIQSMTVIKEMDESLPFICHGFLDMQVNGYNGSDYSLDDLDRMHIDHILSSLALSGTTQHVPTIVTSPQTRLIRNLRTLAKERSHSPLVAAAIVGYHIEGPYISSEDGPRGAHDPRYTRDPDYEEFLTWQDAADGLIKIVTIAPERSGALDFIEKIVDSGVIAAIGHTAASPGRIREAISAGCSLSTHLGNGSHATLPRLANYVWEQLASDELYCGIISDGFHLPAAVIKSISRVKGMDRVILISDAVLPGGYPPGLCKWGNIDIEVFKDGHLGLPGTDYLAGAAHLLDWDIPRFMRFTGASLSQAVNPCTVNPSRLLSPSTSTGNLCIGDPANLVVFRYDPDSPRLEILKTLIDGTEVYSGPDNQRGEL